MPVITDTTQFRKPRTNPDPNPDPASHPQLSRSKSTISSLLTQTLTLNPPKNKKSNNFAALRGLGCAAVAHVSVPAAIRSAADWDNTQKKNNVRVSKKKAKRNKSIGIINPTAEVCCGPGIGLSTDAASVDCVVRRERGRLKIDVEKTNQRERERERPLCSTRRMVNTEFTSFMDSEHSIEEAMHSRFDVFGRSRYNRHVRHPSPEGFAEIMMLHSSLMMGGRSERFDRYRELRLDVDHMSYEDLLELGDRIGHVNTGLKEDEIVHCLKQTKFLNRMLAQLPTEMEGKCSICQEDYEDEDEIGKLECGHFYHIDCVKQWLARRNVCPICKTAAAPQ